MKTYPHVACFCLLILSSALAAEEQKKIDSKSAESSRTALYKKFTETLSGVEMVGKFTILGQEDQKLREESYTIKSVTKLPGNDLWLFQARMKYGGKDITLPLPLYVKWAGDTPVITLTNLTIPGLGTFSSRVVIYNGKYAGTWTHGKVGGHMFGKVVKIKTEEEKNSQ